MDRTGLKRSTIARYLALFNAWGLLGRVRAGSTKRTRGNHPDDTAGNLAGEYVLCVPAEAEQQVTEPVEETRTPSTLRQEGGSKPHAHAREDGHPKPTAKPWPIGDAPQTRRDELHASRRLHNQSPILRRLPTARYLRSLLRPCFAAGWSPAQVLYALDHTPDEAVRWQTADVRHVPAWIRHRLNAWQRPDGSWQTPPAQLGAGCTTDLEHADVVELCNAPRLTAEANAAQAGSARARLAETLRRITRKQPQRVGLGVSLPDADGQLRQAATEPPGQRDPRNPYDVDDPRHEYAAKADEDAAADLLTAAQNAEQHRTPLMGDGFDWLARSLQRRQTGQRAIA